MRNRNLNLDELKVKIFITINIEAKHFKGGREHCPNNSMHTCVECSLDFTFDLDSTGTPGDPTGWESDVC